MGSHLAALESEVERNRADIDALSSAKASLESQVKDLEESLASQTDKVWTFGVVLMGGKCFCTQLNR